MIDWLPRLIDWLSDGLIDWLIGWFRILVSSDIHLGYGEKLPGRGLDSFNTFDEILAIGRREKVDMCILGTYTWVHIQIVDRETWT